MAIVQLVFQVEPIPTLDKLLRNRHYKVFKNRDQIKLIFNILSDILEIYFDRTREISFAKIYIVRFACVKRHIPLSSMITLK